MLYKKNKLNLEDPGLDTINDRFNSFKSNGWYVLDPEATVKFNLNGSDIPTLA
jgi:hypothetical protein